MTPSTTPSSLALSTYARIKTHPSSGAVLVQMAIDRATADLKLQLKEMTARKDGAFATIYEIADAAYPTRFSGGKAQVEIIGRVRSIREQLEKWQADSMAAARRKLRRRKGKR